MQNLTFLFGQPRCAASWITWCSSLSLLAGLSAWSVWMLTGIFWPVQFYFHYVSPIMLVGLACVQLLFAVLAWRRFAPDQTMWVVWGCLTLAGFSQLLGALWAQIFGTRTPLNPFPQLATSQTLRSLGVFLAGPLFLSFLLLAFSLAIAVYFTFGWKSRLRWHDWPPIVLQSVFVALQSWDLFTNYPDQLRQPSRLTPWLTDPLLLLLLILSAILWRSAGSTSGGLTGLCWGFYGAGLLMMALGDIGQWAQRMRHISWQQASLVTWFIWLPAYAAFALGPACQLQAVKLARRQP